MVTEWVSTGPIDNPELEYSFTVDGVQYGWVSQVFYPDKKWTLIFLRLPARRYQDSVIPTTVNYNTFEEGKSAVEEAFS